MRIIDEHLLNINNKLLNLWEMTIEAYINIKKAYSTENKKLALKTARNDRHINYLEEEINEDIVKAISLHSPVASDLRLLISSIKIAGQLERIADYTVNISDYILLIDEKVTELDYSTCINSYINYIDKNVLEIIDLLIEMLQLGKQSFIQRDILLIKHMIDVDKKIDKLYKKSLNKILKFITDEKDNLVRVAKTNMKTILLFKYLERSGDHIVNVAEIVFYFIKGKSCDYHLLDDILSEEDYEL